MRSMPNRVPIRVIAMAASVVVLSAVMPAASVARNRMEVAGDPSPAALPGASETGTTADSTIETLAFILRAQNLGQLESSVEQGVTSYLSVDQFAEAYGQPAANVAALRQYLAEYGISTTAYPDHLDVVATGTAAEFNKALAVKQNQYHVPQQSPATGTNTVPAQNVHAATTSPSLPSPIAGYVLAVLGLSSYSPFTTQLVHAKGNAEPAGATRASGASGEQQCEELTDLPDACNTPGDFAARYHLNGLYSRGAKGQGETVAIVTLAAVDKGAPQFFWKNIADLMPSGRTLKVENIDGGPGTPTDASGTGETDLDLEQSGALAPDADVIDYQAPNSDPGFADAWFTVASQNKADSVSTSWGESETLVAALVAGGEETPAYNEVFDEAFLELAAQGQSGFTAAGDAGAYDASDDLGTTNLSVDTNADSAYITAAGGTTLPWRGTLIGPTGVTAPVSVTAERAWGWDYLWQPTATIDQEPLVDAAESMIGGGGGGYSTDYSQPLYQYRVPGTTSYSDVPYLTPKKYENIGGIVEPTEWSFDPMPSTMSGSQSSRAVPDLSTDADPFTGYLLYEPSFAGVNQPELEGGWGGTSFVAPQLNGSAAVIDSYLGHRVGFWNPAIYSFATGSRSPMTPLDTSGPTNDNLYFSGTAGTVYNPATGLGTPNFGKLGADFHSLG